MGIDGSSLLIFSLCCAFLAAAAVLLLKRASRSAPPARRDLHGLLSLTGWLSFCAGVGGSGLLVLAHAGRLGPEHLWFRAPSFYVAAAVLLAAGTWWVRRTASPLLRFGIPIAAVACVALVLVAGRIDGRAAPAAMLMPTLDTPAPALSYFELDGRRRTLDELRGKVVLLNFWATWCVPCRREMPMLSGMHRQHEDDGLVVLYVSLEEPEVITDFLARNPFDGIHGRLDQAAEFYGAGKFYPLSYLITRDGRVAARWSGRPSKDWLAQQVASRL